MVEEGEAEAGAAAEAAAEAAGFGAADGGSRPHEALGEMPIDFLAPVFCMREPPAAGPEEEEG